MKLSIVTTLYKSSPYIEEFYRRIVEQSLKISSDIEIIMVDDGSPDNSLDVALGIQKKDPRVCIIELSRNFGHHKAIMTGLEHANGDLVFLIDSDLEEPPELLEKFYKKLIAENIDVVFGFQEIRKGGWFEKFTGKIAWHLIDLLLPIKVQPNLTTVRLMTGKYTRALVQHKEQRTAIGGLWALTGFRQQGQAIEKGSRGVTSYSFLARLSTMLNSITSFSEVPLFGVFFTGLFIFTVSLLLTVGLVIRRFTGGTLEGWVSVMVSVWLLGGLGIFSIGIVGLYISRIFIETKNRPYTIIRNIHGLIQEKKHD
jgi:putative glycosyltransferase